MTEGARLLIDCSQVTKTPRGMGLYTIDVVRSLDEKKKLLLVFRANDNIRELYKNLNLNANAIFLPFPQIVIEQILIPILIVS